jgi:hypothetical protein
MPSLGYLIDDPLAIAAREKPENWPMQLLVPTSVPVPDDFDTDCGPTLDQDGVGACVMFSATSVRSYQEKADELGWKFSSQSAFVGYKWLKNGHGAYPGDGAPDAEGSYPLAVWTLAKVEGIPGSDGIGRKIAAYYQLRGTPGDQAWIDTQIQVLLQYGPVTVSSAWPNNWWTADAKTGLLPYPAGIAGGHQWVRKGYTLKGPVGPISAGLSPTGRYWRNRQSWGQYGATDRFGRSGEFLTPFEGDSAYYNLQIGEVWKTLDVIDHPKPVVWTAHVPAGPINVYSVTNGLIVARRSFVTVAFTSVCTTPKSYTTAPGWTINGKRASGSSSATLVKLSTGSLAGKWITVAAAHLTHT